MQHSNLSKIAAIAIAAIIIIYGALFKVDQREYAVIFQFGEAVRIIDKPGLNIKVPFIQDVILYDKRVLSVNPEAKEVTAADGKRIIVDAFAKYKIVDPVKFYRTVSDDNGVRLRLSEILESSLRQVIGTAPLITLLTVERSNIMHKIKDSVNEEAKRFGIDVIDVRITRADLPLANSQTIYSRMQTEREKESRQIRAEGKEEAARIISRADKEKNIILAEAYKQAEIIKGEGDAEAAQIYSHAFAQDPEFYNFYRSMDSYTKVLNENDTNFVITPKGEYFKHLRMR